MHTLPRIHDAGPLAGKRVLVRADFNVPVVDGVVIDSTRISKNLRTIKWLVAQGAKVGVISRIESAGKTLEPIVPLLSAAVPVTFCRGLDLFSRTLATTDTGRIVLLENVRLLDGEMTNDPGLARLLAATADIFVNDAFSVSHRMHASVVGIAAHIPSYAGLQFEAEYKALSAALTPEHPFVFMLGGAKFDTKVPLVQKFLELADTVFVGGALAHNFFRAAGYDIGHSLVAEGSFNEKELLKNGKLFLPVDVIAETTDGSKQTRVTIPEALRSDEKIVDNGPKTVAQLIALAHAAKLVVWNGPLGAYEFGYKHYTLDLARGLSECALDGVKTILGGGDTVAAIKELDIEHTFTHVSTAGGAMLEFLEKGTLPGIEALVQN